MSYTQFCSQMKVLMHFDIDRLFSNTEKTGATFAETAQLTCLSVPECFLLVASLVFLRKGSLKGSLIPFHWSIEYKLQVFVTERRLDTIGQDDVLAGELRLHQGCVRHAPPQDGRVDRECGKGDPRPHDLLTIATKWPPDCFRPSLGSWLTRCTPRQSSREKGTVST